MSLLLIRETRGYLKLEAAPGPVVDRPPSLARIFHVTSIGNLSLFAACQAGLVNNLNDGMSWGLYPLFFSAHGLDVERIGVIKATYPIVWGLLQIATGMLSDRVGRKGLIAWGMVVQAGGIWLTVLVPAYGAWLLGAVLQGLGTAMVYPTLLAAIADHAHPDVARLEPRRLPVLARPRICHRRPALRAGRRLRWARGGDPSGRRAHPGLGPGRGVGDAPAAPGPIAAPA